MSGDHPNDKTKWASGRTETAPKKANILRSVSFQKCRDNCNNRTWAKILEKNARPTFKEWVVPVKEITDSMKWDTDEI